MFSSRDRRGFLKRVAAAGAAVGLGDLSFPAGLPPVSAADLQPLPGVVPLRPEIEPLVRLLEDTPRNRLLEEVAARVRGGLTYRELLAALLLAGVRNVQPRPSVGFKFHAVLVVNSVHLAATASPETERWLPLFWGLDYFKDSQARDVQEGNWTMRPVDESAVPPADKARAAFVAAMDNWDESAADAAVAGLARTARRRMSSSCSTVTAPGLPFHRAQSDLRRRRGTYAAIHRLGARRAGVEIAGLRTADARGGQPGPAGRRSGSAVAAACELGQAAGRRP